MRTVKVLVFDQVNALDVTGPLEALSMVQSDNQPAYRAHLSSADGPSITCENGLKLLADDMLGDDGADLLLVPGGSGLRQPERLARLGEWLRRNASRFERIVTICTGAWILGASGLGAGRRVCTHWRFVPALRNAYPKLDVVEDALFVADGNLWSSGGISAGIDLALALIEVDHGPTVAMSVARELVVYLRRDGAQAQFSEPLRLQARAQGPLAPVCLWAAQNLGGDLSVEALAARAALSPRQFARRFKNDFGLSPARYINRLRLDKARQALESGNAPIQQVAVSCGFKSADGFRKAFEHSFGINPADYRKRFHNVAGETGS